MRNLRSSAASEFQADSFLTRSQDGFSRAIAAFFCLDCDPLIGTDRPFQIYTKRGGAYVLIIHVDLCTAGFSDNPHTTVIGLGVVTGIVSTAMMTFAVASPMAGIIGLQAFQMIAEDGGIAQGVHLMHFGIGDKYGLLQRPESILPNHQVEDSAGNPMIIGHILIHHDRDGLSGGSSNKLI